MTRDTYERALKSAAQIAFLSFIAGCGAATPVDGPEALGESEPGATTGDDGKSEKVLSSTEACRTPILSDKTCKKELKSAYPNGDPDWYGNGTPRQPTAASDATLAKCCEQVYFKGGQNQGTPEMRDSGCCAILKLAQSPVVGLACTPWGPPMPVAMRRSRRGIA